MESKQSFKEGYRPKAVFRNTKPHTNVLEESSSPANISIPAWAQDHLSLAYAKWFIIYIDYLFCYFSQIFIWDIFCYGHKSR